MKTRTWLILLGILIAIPVGWYLISPLFINKTVNEDFPDVQPIEVMETKETPAMNDEMPEGEILAAEGPSTMTPLLQGSFYNLAHESEGTATVYQLADGSRILRFENFEVLNGPDLHVYLATQDPVPNTVGLELEGSLDLGELKGNLGDQNYEIPTDLDLSAFHSVVIWCVPFRVPFSAAPLRVP